MQRGTRRALAARRACAEGLRRGAARRGTTTFCRTCQLSEQIPCRGRSVSPGTTFCGTCQLSEQIHCRGRSVSPGTTLCRTCQLSEQIRCRGRSVSPEVAQPPMSTSRNPRCRRRATPRYRPALGVAQPPVTDLPSTPVSQTPTCPRRRATPRYGPALDGGAVDISEKVFARRGVTSCRK